MVPGSYNNNVQILQIPGYVAIVNEMVHSARIIPLDGRPHGDLRQWSATPVDAGKVTHWLSKLSTSNGRRASADRQPILA